MEGVELTNTSYNQPLYDAFTDAEEAVTDAEPRTLAGLASKIVFLGRLSMKLDGVSDYSEAVENCGSLSCEAMLAAFARDAAALSERPVAPGSDALVEGSDA